MIRQLVAIFLAALSMNVGYLFGTAILAQPEPHDSTPVAELAFADPDTARMHTMVAQGECWTGAQPADMEGKVPGHVWVGGQYYGPKMVAKALEQVFGDVNHHIGVNAFCR